MTVLQDPLAIRFINQYQGGFPVTSHPYAKVARTLRIDENHLIDTIRSLLDEGWISRFAPLIDAQQLGGAVTLAALSVPRQRFDEVTAMVNQFVEVSHNYRREHRLNMWFVISCDSQQRLAQVIEQIGRLTGLQVYNCPKLKEYYVGLQFVIDQNGPVTTVPVDNKPAHSAGLNPVRQLASIDRSILTLAQNGLVLESQPYLHIARQLKLSESEVIVRLHDMLDSGIIRRIGAIPNHYKLGFHGNGMVVWNIPDSKVDRVGKLFGLQSFVSHCYLRPRHLPNWPYNLFTMVHGRDRNEVSGKVRILENFVSANDYDHQVLYSTSILKKTGIRLVPGWHGVKSKEYISKVS